MTPQSRDRGLAWFTNAMARWVPDAITAAVILTFLTLAVALALGNPVLRVIDAYHQGLWMLLPFTMQMTLILVLSLALATTPFSGGPSPGWRGLPHTRNQFIVLAFLSAGIDLLRLLGTWLRVKPDDRHLLRHGGGAQRHRHRFPVSAGRDHCGPGALAIRPFVERAAAGRQPGPFSSKHDWHHPSATTIWSPAAMIHEVTFTVVAIFAACWMMPKRVRPISSFPESHALAKALSGLWKRRSGTASSFAQRLERSPFVPAGAGFVCSPAGCITTFVMKRLSHDINSLNTHAADAHVAVASHGEALRGGAGTGRRQELGTSSCSITCTPELRA